MFTGKDLLWTALSSLIIPALAAAVTMWTKIYRGRVREIPPLRTERARIGHPASIVCAMAFEGREKRNAAHGASRGCQAEIERAPKERKNIAGTSSLGNGANGKRPVCPRFLKTGTWTLHLSEIVTRTTAHVGTMNDIVTRILSSHSDRKYAECSPCTCIAEDPHPRG